VKKIAALWDYESTLASEVASVKVLVRQAVSLSWFGLARATDCLPVVIRFGARDRLTACRTSESFLAVNSTK